MPIRTVDQLKKAEAGIKAALGTDSLEAPKRQRLKKRLRRAQRKRRGLDVAAAKREAAKPKAAAEPAAEDKAE